MTQLAGVDVVRLALQVGIPDAQLTTCVAIAWAESGLRTDALGHNGPTAGCPNGSRDRGLWQINDCYHPTVSDAQAFDPLGNAQAMYAISSHGTNWNPWSTFTNGAYQQFITPAGLAVRLAESTSGGSGGPAPSNPYLLPPPDDVYNVWQWMETGAAPWQAALALIRNLYVRLATQKYGAVNPHVTATGGPLE